MKHTLLCLTLLLAFVVATACKKQSYPIEVAAQKPAYGSCLVRVPVSGLQINPSKPVTLYESINGKERIIPCQIAADESGKICLYWLLSGEMPANSKRFYRFETGKSKQRFPDLKITDTGKNLILKKGNNPILSYRYALSDPVEGIDSIFCRSGFIHPAWSPAGNVLTNSQPADHHHHYGIWNPWTRVVYDGATYDLWNLGDRQGTVAFKEMVDVCQGPVWTGFTARQDHLIFKENQKVCIMDELWKIKAWAVTDKGRDYFVWDFTSYLTPCTLLPVLLQEYRYAGFGYRATGEWTKENCIMYTSEGLSRPKIDGTNARWIYITGAVGNGKSGLLMMGYPENRKFPEPLRIWDEKANNERGDAFINFAPTKNEDWLLDAGKTYRLKYRVVTYDGDMTPEKAEQLWNDFANPPAVTIKQKPFGDF